MAQELTAPLAAPALRFLLAGLVLAGFDTVISTVSYMLGANVENLTLSGSDFAEVIGNELDNLLTGNEGSNHLFGGTGADAMRGGAGDDGYVVDHPADTDNENADDGYDWVLSYITYSLGDNLEDLELGGTANINANGNDSDNWIGDNAGDNVLSGNGGSDILVTHSSGTDSLDGGLGDDMYAIWAQAIGTKTVSSTDSTPGKVDTLSLQFNPLATTVERAGLDLKLSFAGSAATVIIKNYFASVGATLIERFEFADETVWTPADIASKLPAATEGDDYILGTTANDTISALGGNHVVDAGDGYDTIDGGSGDDVLNGQNGLDNLTGGTGNVYTGWTLPQKEGVVTS